MYELPPEAIAQSPLAERDQARLMVDRGDRVSHRRVSDLPELLGPGDVVVVNDTRVLPARLRMRRATGGAVEVLLLHARDDGDWEALVRPSRRLKPGELVAPDAVTRNALTRDAVAGDAVTRDVTARDALSGGVVTGDAVTGDMVSVDTGGARTCVEIRDDLGEGRRVVRVHTGGRPLLEVLDEIGAVALPPYITADLDDPERYQTVYARRAASAAAPTAGLHLTDRLLARIRDAGAEVATVELAVGLDTFRPVTAARLDDHRMHSEQYCVPSQTRQALNRAHRVVAVGTTVVRCLEAWAATGEASGHTSLFIRRPFQWRVVDALMTNFHLPRSTLLCLLDAFIGPRWRALYGTALDHGYRFLSFGDAMFVTRPASAAAVTASAAATSAATAATTATSSAAPLDCEDC